MTRRTSKITAKVASKLLKNPSSSKDTKKVSASALSQRSKK